MLAPLGVSTGDGRRFAVDGASWRQLPLALKWQRSDEQGHDKSVAVGSLDAVNIGTVAEAIDAGWISAAAVADRLQMDTLGVWGAGELFDDVNRDDMPRLFEDVAEAKLLTGKRVIGPSVDAGAAEAVYVPVGSDDPMTEDEYWSAWEETGEEPPVELLFTTYEIAAATLVTIPAFAECRPFELVAALEPALTAAVRSSGWDDMPLGDRDAEWDGDAAAGRLAEHCGIDGEEPDWGCYASGFLYVDDAADQETRGAYGFGIVDVADGGPVIVPAAVYAVAEALEDARSETTIPEADQEAMRTVVEGLYERMASEWDDDTVTVPWAAAKRDEECAAQAALIAAVSASAGPVVDPSWFDDPQLDAVTPLTVTDDGRIFGHVATHSTCHVGIRDACVTAPVDETGYGAFHRYPLDTADGSLLAVGRITTGRGEHRCRCGTCRGSNDDHACVTLTAAGAMAHHDQLTTLAWVRAGEDVRNGAIWVAGIVAPGLDDTDRARLAAGVDVSGDWRQISGQHQLIEVLALASEKPGFPLPRLATSHTGRVMALTAAGTIPRRRTPLPLAAQVAEQLTTGPALDRLAGAIADHLTVMTSTVTPAADAAVAGEPAAVDAATVDTTPVDVAAVEAAAGEFRGALAAAAIADLERAVR
jgi:hypothetical protein